MDFKKRTLASLIAIMPLMAQAQFSQTDVNNFAKETTLTFAVVDNFHNKDAGFLGTITLNNQSDVALPAGESDWQLYIHSVRKISTELVAGLNIEHVNGDLHRITPTKNFTGLASGKSLVLEFDAQVWVVAYSDFMPRAFFVSGDNKPAIFANTDSEDMTQFVAPFERENQLRRYNEPKDLTVLVTPQVRFERNQQTTSQVSQQDALKRIIPKPQKVEFNRGNATLDSSWQITFQGQLKNEVMVFMQDLQDDYGLTLKAQPDHIKLAKEKLISLKVNPQLAGGKSESYTLEIDDDRIEIVGSDNAGVFYAMQSLLNLLPANSQGTVDIPQLEIEDSPRYTWRGMHYDNGRNYHGKDAMFKLVEQMARYKMNKLHWHFSEDEGWRLEIPGLPELTDIGGYRCFDLEEKECLLTQLGTGPFKSGSGNGYLTRSEFIELLTFAKDRHIQIIPEIEGPGHARASIKAMEARYHKLADEAQKTAKNNLINKKNAGKETQQVDISAATQYLLSDPKDTSVYMTVQNYKDNSMNVCMDSTYAFLDKVTYELQQMYREAGVQLTNLHFGGDEVGAGSWVGSPICQAMFADPNNGVAGAADLKPYFTQRVAKLLEKRGISPGAWEDGLMYDRTNPFKRDEFPNKTFTANVWDNIWEWGVADRAYRLANAGYQVILSHGTHLYFDHPYEAHPEERGYYWATRYTDTKKAFNYMPDDVYANADYTRTREPIDNLEALVGRPLPKLEKPENILGMQGQVWSETIRTEDQVLAMIFPRILSVAERAWHKAPWEGEQVDRKSQEKDWAQFSAAVGLKELTKLANAGVTLNLPVPGGVINNGKLEINTPFAYLNTEYSLDNGASWQQYTAPISVSEQQSVALRSSLNSKLKSRITHIN
ncbi:family 20 glycosylhydrolase [Pseudoalteromonas sp. SG44-8]|uniref:family 20 glycosylhydrolase n=1 Tax=Pseudoalteromonas sp. SG44-8 TaxID=2760958 RepID=UPI0016027E57|nr:family 20 glycosylhydrolase [Pseudoalteromonas sp. SG44-8]MBB1399470.1 carbohydate-binding domain-containing protein [Pseudoalteromonas sp. SG44-8]